MIFNIPPDKIKELTSDISALQGDVETLGTFKAYRVTGTISQVSLTITKSAITADMVPVCCEFGTPANVSPSYTITTSPGRIVFSNITLTASTTVDVILIKTN